MKIRNGFVSNSSSSSFVIFGFEANLTDLTKLGFNPVVDDDDYDDYEYTEQFIFKLGYDINGEHDIIGKRITSFIDDYAQDGSISIEELGELAKKISKKFNVPLNSIKLYYGTEMC